MVQPHVTGAALFALRRPRALIRLAFTALLAAILFLGALPNPAGATPLATTGTIYFSQTGHALHNGFLSYWLWHGQADRWGYPITEEMQEGGRTVQYLQRGILEYDPSAPADRQVTAGLAGSLLTTGRHFPAGAAIRTTSTATYFPQTQHTLHDGFYGYWKNEGGLASFGYPISEAFVEGAHLVQYFQRARFERTTGGGVWLGYIGEELLAKRGDPGQIAALSRPEFEMHFNGGATWFHGDWPHVISLNQNWGNLPRNFHGYGLYAAMPADLNLYGRWGRVTRGNKSIWVQFIDVIASQDIAQVRADGKVIDLGTESFQQLAPLGDGVIRVTVDVAWPGFQPDFAR